MRIKSAVSAGILFAFISAGLAAQEIGSSNYIYSRYYYSVSAPPAYVHGKSVSGADFRRQDLFTDLADGFTTNSLVYILCKNKLIQFDYDFKLQNVLHGYTGTDGVFIPFENCSGIFVTEAGDYYIAQAENSRILHFNADNSLRRTLQRPDIPGFENVDYRPDKITVDHSGRLYVIAKGMFEGMIELDADGTFSRFYGKTPVQINPVELLWRNLATKEQRKRQRLWLPTDFTNMSMDNDGFIFATVQGTEKTGGLKRFNTSGINILQTTDNNFPIGDHDINSFGYGIPVGMSQFTAVATGNFGMYLALDSVRSRVFAYDEDHRMLFILGGRGEQKGYFLNPIDVCFAGRNIVVLDSLAQSVEIFYPTLYGDAIYNAIAHQHNYRYEEAMEMWKTALAYNYNCTVAYSGIGRCLLRQKNYADSLYYLERGNDRPYYSRAFEKVRNQKLRKAFPVILWIIIIYTLLRILLFTARKTGLTAAAAHSRILFPATVFFSRAAKYAEKPLYIFWKFPCRILGSPFKGFDEMKYEKKGSYIFAFFILCLSALLNIMEYVYNGFLINFHNPQRMDSIFLSGTVFFIVLLFVTSNWSVTTLLDGKGRYGHIFLTLMYALFPVCILRLIALVLTNVLTLEEMAIAFACLTVAGVLFVLYLFIGLAVIHEYSFTKCLVSLLLTILAMGIITFILMLLFSLGAETVDFAVTVARELLLKYF